MAGRIDADIYRDDFTNIQQTFTPIPGTLYVANVAAARLQGFELHMDLLPTRDWEITLNYSYTDDRFTKWVGLDLYGQAHFGDPLCLPGSSAGPPAFCLLDLHNNPFPYAPPNQGSITVRYRLPIDPSLGAMTASLTGYAQSREYLINGANRILQLLPNFQNAISQPAFATLNARLDWRDIQGSRWNAAVFVDNLTNTTYALGGTAQPFTFNSGTKLYAPPRMFGVNVSYRFGA